MKKLTGLHVLALILGFFGVTIGVNAVFITYAYSTFTGEDVPRAYLQGLAYNQTLNERSAQNALAWHVTIDLRRDAGETLADVSINDKEGAPQSGLSAAITFRRPTNAALDQSADLAAASAGRYQARLQHVPAGQWDVTVRTTSHDGKKVEATRRVVLP
jgi:nitrogen fixation protein FixH